MTLDDTSHRWWQRKRKPQPQLSAFDQRTLPGVPDVFTGRDTTYGAMRKQATAMAEHDWNTPSERGLAMAILAIIEDFERELTSVTPPEKVPPANRGESDG